MRFQRPLDTLLDSAVKVRLLRFLCRKGGEWSGRRLAAELGVNPVTAHRALRQLHQETVLDLRKIGASFAYSLREEHHLVRELLKPLFQQEIQAQGQLIRLLQNILDKRLRSQVVSVVLYGSLSRRQERPTSDVDVLVLVRSERAKRQAREALEPLWEETARTFGNPLALYINTVEEGREKIRRRMPLFQSILKDHQLVWGKSLEEVLRGRAA